ncbi:hypothetical protein [Enterococcus sp.]|uniref:hypothetical protein n=1 Tax=Enterococcus sp. TaxID=35783 RepID=UPI00290A0BDC|nr:hypothetical protein [Enterococcus sp.]MDU5335814.1 hypothetical protein [Enterococcus sp.]
MRKSKEHLERLSFSVLRVVESNANIEILINDDFSYFDLMKTINDLKKNGLLRDYLGDLELTKHGLDELRKLESNLDIGNVGKMIIPDFRYFVDQIGINDVYLP